MSSSCRVLRPLALTVALLAGGCGDKAAPPTSQKPPSPERTAAEASGGVDACALLSADEVARVLPGSTGGMATHSGGSLIQGVEAYQCSWVNANGDLLTVILNVATDDARFAQIRPGDAVRDNREAVDVADQGWLAVTPDEVKLKAVKGRTVIDVELMEAGAAGKSADITELGKAVAAKAP